MQANAIHHGAIKLFPIIHVNTAIGNMIMTYDYRSIDCSERLHVKDAYSKYVRGEKKNQQLFLER